MINEKDILANLTPEQLAAVTHKDGPLLVLAGAGSGKTRVVTRRIAWLISRGVWPEQILAMTFTNRAAKEMRSRVETMTGSVVHGLGTFHSCCARFLRRDIEKINCGRTSDFSIYDADDQKNILKACIKESSYVPSHVNPGMISAVISNAKNSRCTFADAVDEMGLARESRFILPICDQYEAKLKSSNAVDFDDLLGLMARVLEEVPSLRDMYHHRFRYILVDEYQDTNHLQYELIKLLINEDNNLHVTGDPDQCIYSWRGADYSNIMNFTHDFPGAEIVTLERNYRSTQTILDAANCLIRNNEKRFNKNLFTDREGGSKITVIGCESDRNEAMAVAAQLEKMIANGVSWRSIAIFYRTNAQSRLLEEQLVNYGIPYQLLGGLRFYERMEVKDFVALLRFLVNHSDEAAFNRIVSQFPQADGIGPRTAVDMVNHAGEAGLPILDYLVSEDFLALFGKGKTKKAIGARTFSDFMRKLIQVPLSPVGDAAKKIFEISGMKDSLERQYGEENLKNREENLYSMLQKAETFAQDNPEATLADLLEDIALIADVDNHDPNADCVTLMTLHSSKGLEFPFVFITGVEAELLPHSNAGEDIEEERRLFYVGITRAQQAVFLFYSGMRYKMGRPAVAFPSQFLQELPAKLLDMKVKGINRENYHQPVTFQKFNLGEQVRRQMEQYKSEQKPRDTVPPPADGTITYDESGEPVLIREN